MQLIEEKQVRGSARQLHNEPAKDSLAVKRQPHDAVQRIFRDRRQGSTTERRAQQLPKRAQRHRLLLQISCSATNEVEARTRWLDIDVKKLAAQPEVECER